MLTLLIMHCGSESCPRHTPHWKQVRRRTFTDNVSKCIWSATIHKEVLHKWLNMLYLNISVVFCTYMAIYVHNHFSTHDVLVVRLLIHYKPVIFYCWSLSQTTCFSIKNGLFCKFLLNMWPNFMFWVHYFKCRRFFL